MTQFQGEVFTFSVDVQHNPNRSWKQWRVRVLRCGNVVPIWHDFEIKHFHSRKGAESYAGHIRQRLEREDDKWTTTEK